MAIKCILTLTFVNKTIGVFTILVKVRARARVSVIVRSDKRYLIGNKMLTNINMCS